MLVSLERSESDIKWNSPEHLWQSPSLDIGFLGYSLTIAVEIIEKFDSLSIVN